MKINLFFCLLICFAMLLTINTYSKELLADDIGMSAKEKAEWNEFVENIECNISSNINYADLKAEKFPVFKITLNYKGDSPYKLKWDNNFGRVLWEGKFVLKSAIYKLEESTSELKYQTSNTYEVEKEVVLKKGSSITSTLDFTELPVFYAKHLFITEGDVHFALYAVIYNKKYSLSPISNSLDINVK